MHRCIGMTTDQVAIRGELVRERWYTVANGIDTRNVPTVDRVHVQTLIDWVKTAGSPMLMQPHAAGAF